MLFVVILMAARMTCILCSAVLRSPLNTKDISGDISAFDYQRRQHTHLYSSARLLSHIIRI